MRMKKETLKLFLFPLKFHRIIDLGIRAAGAQLRITADRLNPVRRGFDYLFDFRLRTVFLLFRNRAQESIPRRSAANKTAFARRHRGNGFAAIGKSVRLEYQFLHESSLQIIFQRLPASTISVLRQRLPTLLSV